LGTVLTHVFWIIAAGVLAAFLFIGHPALKTRWPGIIADEEGSLIMVG
jgi:hypothetical protein